MRGKFSNVLWGLFFIIIGVIIAGNVVEFWDVKLFFDGWWTLFIIIPCFISIIQNGFSAGPAFGVVIGLLLLGNYYLDLDFDIWKLLLPVVLIFIGARIMFQGGFRRRNSSNQRYSAGGNTRGNYTDENRAEYTAVFSSKYVRLSDEFFGTALSAVFGAVVLDLRDAAITGDVEINATATFGGIDIHLPDGVNVRVSNLPIFGGVSGKHLPSDDPAAPTIYLKSTCIFGGIDFK